MGTAAHNGSGPGRLGISWPDLEVGPKASGGGQVWRSHARGLLPPWAVCYGAFRTQDGTGSCMRCMGTLRPGRGGLPSCPPGFTDPERLEHWSGEFQRCPEWRARRA